MSSAAPSSVDYGCRSPGVIRMADRIGAPLPQCSSGASTYTPKSLPHLGSTGGWSEIPTGTPTPPTSTDALSASISVVPSSGGTASQPTASVVSSAIWSADRSSADPDSASSAAPSSKGSGYKSPSIWEDSGIMGAYIMNDDRYMRDVDAFEQEPALV